MIATIIGRTTQGLAMLGLAAAALAVGPGWSVVAVLRTAARREMDLHPGEWFAPWIGAGSWYGLGGWLLWSLVTGQQLTAPLLAFPAGLGATAALVAWALYDIRRHPEVWGRGVRREIPNCRAAL